MGNVFSIAGFDELSKKEMASIYNVAVTKKFKPGDKIVREGEREKSFHFIVEGSAEVYKMVSGGQVYIENLSAGEWVGEIAMAVNTERVATVVAATALTTMLFTPEAFNSLPEKIRVHFQKLFLTLATKRLSALERKMSDAKDKLSKLGKYVEAYRQRAEESVKSEVVQEIIAKIPKLPPFVGNLASRIMDENAPVAEIAESIKADPSLTGLVLKAVNSPFYGVAEKISDIYRAFLFLGANKIISIVMDEGLHSSMPKTKEFEALRRKSLMVSILAHDISLASKNKGASNVNGTIGLLHNMGSVVVYLVKRQNPKAAPLLDLLAGPKVGAQLLTSWGLPEKICAVVGMLEHPEFMPPEKIPEGTRKHLSAVYLANRCADRLMGAPNFAEKEIFFDNYAAAIGLQTSGCGAFMTSTVLPAMHKNKNTLPNWIRDLAEAHPAHA
ncbi:MAG: HDOD domain-containing protein [Nitrospinae bacterium]|nr:HDOD domain-containing protein [Nitrospinota bacterium]